MAPFRPARLTVVRNRRRSLGDALGRQQRSPESQTGSHSKINPLGMAWAVSCVTLSGTTTGAAWLSFCH